MIFKEIETLTANLEHCQKELVEKYGTVKALHMHSRMEQAHNRRITKKAVDASKQLEHVSHNFMINYAIN